MSIPAFSARKAWLALGVISIFIAIILQARLSNTFDPNGMFFPTHAFSGGDVWKLEIAHTDPVRALGLGDRDGLPKDRGMLFLFDTPKPYGFWMKGMRFPIDMLFLFQGKIVFIERSIQPSDPKIVIPPSPVNQVLELNAGAADKLLVGDRIWFWRSF